MAKVLGFGRKLNKFELQSLYIVHFWTNTSGKCTNFIILKVYVLIVSLLFLYKNDFSIK